MKLLLDFGNTRLKWALWDGATLMPGTALTHTGLDSIQEIVPLWKDIKKIDAAWAASVVAPVLEDALMQAVKARFGIELHFAHSSAIACGVRNAYAQPERLGVDRFLGLIVLHAKIIGPAVLVSCGTALTLDALAADGEHLGGWITASPALMSTALLSKTTRLGELAVARVVDFADNTADAVESGTWLAAAGLVERFFAKASKRFGVTPALMLSGGGAQRLSELLALPSRIEPDLVLHGLAIFAAQVH